MATFARKLMNRSPLSLSPHLIHQSPINPARLRLSLHRRCLTSVATNPTPNSSSGLSHPNSSGVNRDDLLPKTTSEIFDTLYGKHDHKYWRIFIMTEPGLPWVKGLSTHLTRDQYIHHYINILADVLKSEEEAKKRILFVSTRHAFFFVCKISREIAEQIQDRAGPLPVGVIEPISESDLKREDYAETGEPFINGKAAEYDPIYHKAMCEYLYADVGLTVRKVRIGLKEEKRRSGAYASARLTSCYDTA